MPARRGEHYLACIDEHHGQDGTRHRRHRESDRYRTATCGIQVLIVGLDAEKGARAELDIRQTSNAQVADLGLVRDTRLLASDAAQRCATLSYLVHSAGIVNSRRELTADGIESNFAIKVEVPLDNSCLNG